MRCLLMILVCMVISMAWGDPEPKKYQPETKIQNKNSNSSLTDDERKFLREVEAKFGVKSEVPIKVEGEEHEKTKIDQKSQTVDLPFPAVIAIEIVNDTDSKTKGKRTINANLGYGYKTNTGYSYTYFGNPQSKGHFMYYPYSQEDIPPSNQGHYKHNYHPSSEKVSSVEIKPSQAFELIPLDEPQNGYHYDKPATPFKSSHSNEHQPNNAQSSPLSTYYTTYNGHGFSGFSKNFPTVMPNYFIDSSQLLNTPQYQSAGISQSYLQTHQPQSEQRVVPVLVLRIPSSVIKTPAAELYADLSPNYLKNLNLQELVNEYFKKIGFSAGPEVKAYQSSPVVVKENSIPSPVSQYEPQHYASPYVQPSYTGTYNSPDYSGVHYSAVQPVMAKYPTSYPNQKYYYPHTQTYPAYQQPAQYEHQYQYVPQSADQSQTYYVHEESAASLENQVGQEALHEHDISAYSHPNNLEQSAYVTAAPQSEYGSQYSQAVSYVTAQPTLSPYESVSTAAAYEYPKDESIAYTSEKTLTADLLSNQYNQPKDNIQYYTEKPNDLSESVSLYPEHPTKSPLSYLPQKESHDDSDSGKNIVISENFPSKDHTIATVLPQSYKTKNHHKGSVQIISYVTPSPFGSKYQSPYRIMVPQTVLRNPNSDKVTYVNSHSVPSQFHYSSQFNSNYNPEHEYTINSHFVPVGTQKPPSYPKNHHAYLKRMTKINSTRSSLKKNEHKS